MDFHVFDGKYQGSRSHVISLFSNLIRISPDIEFYFFLNEIEVLRESYEEFSFKNVKLIRMKNRGAIIRICYQLPYFQHRCKLDYMHTQYVIPFPVLSKCFVTIHDILFEDYPQYFGLIFRIRSKLMFRYSARKSKHVFTVSEYSKKKINEIYNIPNDKISVIHNAVDPEVFKPGNDEQELLGTYGLNCGGYLLTVGRLEPRKNHINLVEAYKKVNTEYPLVIIGQQDFGFNEVYDEIMNYSGRGRIVHLNDVSDIDLPALYRHAKLFIYPTWAEGFGMPVLEAMASGVPVITSNTTSLPEVVGDAGILIDPSSIEQIVEEMKVVLSKEDIRQELIRKGLARYKNFKWENAAKTARKIYLSNL